MLIAIIEFLFSAYTLLLLVRVLGSWVPQFAESRFMRFVAIYTDPYLNFFRRFIPPLGMIDISPICAFFALQIAQWILFFVIRSL